MRRLIPLLTLILLVSASCSDDDNAVFGDVPSSTTSEAAPASSAPSSDTTAASDTTQAAATTVPGVPLPPDAAEWTVLVYIMGDTDLEPFALGDMLELAAVGSTDEVNLVALVDRHPEYTADGAHNLPDWEDAKIVEVGSGEFVEVAGSAELNLGSGQVLADFLRFGIVEYPAHHYALILWDHGAGWTGMGPDESNGLDVLDMADLVEGLSLGMHDTWVDRLDIIGFDACLMATYAVASVVAPYADYMIASQELEPGHGWNFEALTALTGNPAMSAVEVGTALIDGYAQQALDWGTDYDITLSLVDLGQISALQGSLGELALATSGDLGPILAGARREAQGYGRNPDPDLDAQLTDLGDLLDNIAQGSPDIAAAATAARATLDTMVVYSTAGPATAGATGLSIYFPEAADYFRQGYLLLDGVPVWPDTLSAYYQLGAEPREGIAAEFLDTGAHWFSGEGLNLWSSVDPAAVSSIVDATAYFGFYDSATDTATFFGQENLDIYDDGDIGTVFDMTYLVLDDQIDTAIGYYELNWDWDTGTGTFDIPLSYEPPDSFDRTDVLLSIVYTEEEIIEEDFYSIGELGTYGAFTSDPEGLVFPRVLEVGPDGTSEWVETLEVGLWADLPFLLYQFPTIESGTEMVVSMEITDFAGNVDQILLFPVAP